MQAIKDFIASVFCFFQRNRYKIEEVIDLPDTPVKYRVYVEGTSPYYDRASFICPCGCDSIISLSLFPESRSSWQLSRDFLGSVSLQPSIWRTKGCKSHFFIKSGRILWARGR